MLTCYYKDITNIECTWSGIDIDLIPHLLSSHNTLSYSTCPHNKISLELVLDLNVTGYRFIILTFIYNNDNYPILFLEFFDESTNIFRIAIKSYKAQGLFYTLSLQNEDSKLEYSGPIENFKDEVLWRSQQCLQVHKNQLASFCYNDDGEFRYKVVVCINEGF